MSSMQQEIHSINLRVEQNQLDLHECLKFHHLAAVMMRMMQIGLYPCLRMFDV